MKVQYDYQVFTNQEYGGISRYFYELISKYSISRELELEIPLKFSNNSYISERQLTKHKSFFHGVSFKGKAQVLTLLNKRASISALKCGQFDLFHPTYYDPYFLEYCSKPFVLTVYDMIHEKFPQCFPAWDRTSAHKRLLCEKANKIIAISQNTKNDLVELFNIPADKVEVICLGNSLKQVSASNISLPPKYLLFVGSRGIYKNFRFLVSGISTILKKNKDLYLVCAGGGKFTSEELKYFRELGISGQVVYIPINDLTLAHVYQNAICFVFPSLYEGFGIPILEAFACNCPVLLSRASCFPEIAGDAALYFEPGNAEDLNSKIESLFSDPELRKAMSIKGTERLKLYSWDKCAEETLRVYKALP